MSGHRRGDGDMVLDSFKEVQRVEWDTLLFFFGIIFAVGGLGVLGYLGLASELLYADLGSTTANVIIGALSAIVDNIPLMFAVLTMDPVMSDGQWLLITLTAGTGGSMLSIGSAAGVALMGQAKGVYTFGAHLKWTWAIALGYIAGDRGASGAERGLVLSVGWADRPPYEMSRGKVAQGASVPVGGRAVRSTVRRRWVLAR